MALRKVKSFNLPVCQSCRHFIRPKDKKHFCPSCNECARVCMCKQRAGIGTFQVPRAKDASIGSSSMFIGSKRAIGLELELSDWGTWRVREKESYSLDEHTHYTIDHDGSVKPSALEAVFKPLAGDQYIINGLNAIARKVWDCNCQVNETCGYHVHVDARDFSWTDIQKLLFLWMKLESGGKLWLLAGRGPTSFSEKWTNWWRSRSEEKVSTKLKRFKAQVIKMLYNVDTTSYKEHISKIKATEDFIYNYNRILAYNKTHTDKAALPKPADYVTELREHKRLKMNRGWNRAVKSRYLNLNIHSWLFRGTVEYRLAAGTVDVDDIRLWPLFCLWLTEAVSRTSLSIIIREAKKPADLIDTILLHNGFPVPSITGEKIYPLNHYLRDWIVAKTQK